MIFLLLIISAFLHFTIVRLKQRLLDKLISLEKFMEFMNISEESIMIVKE